METFYDLFLMCLFHFIDWILKGWNQENEFQTYKKLIDELKRKRHGDVHITTKANVTIIPTTFISAFIHLFLLFIIDPKQFVLFADVMYSTLWDWGVSYALYITHNFNTKPLCSVWMSACIRVELNRFEPIEWIYCGF